MHTFRGCAHRSHSRQPRPPGILRSTAVSLIEDPRRPRQTCDPWAIGAGGDSWQPIDGPERFSGRFDTNGSLVTVRLAMYDDDSDDLFGGDDHLDLTRPDGDDVIFWLDPNNPGAWLRPEGEIYCNVPDPACSDNEGQWCGACNDAQACCDTGNPAFIRGYAFRGDGQGAGLSWSVTGTRRECGARRDVDSDRDGLLDDWETFGLDRDCDGTVDLPFQLWGATPMHKDLFLEYDACAGEPIRKQGILNLSVGGIRSPAVQAGPKQT